MFTMESLLYAEIYLICLIIASVLLYWTGRSDSSSNSELWLKRLLRFFLLNFLCNLLFTIFNRAGLPEGTGRVLSYALKTGYFLTLALGVFAWCGYAEAELQSGLLEKGKTPFTVWILLGIALLIPLVNLFTPWMFDFGEGLVYRRHRMFRVEMWYLFAVPLICSVRLLRRARTEADRVRRAQLTLAATFPLSMLFAAVLSYAGEAVPVICVCVAVELLCLYIGNMHRQISMDKLTQVNNRQNLFGFMSHKLKNHAQDLWLLMIDLDFFKTINDTYGHLEGDRALTRLAGVLKASCADILPRPYIARYGGDEFIIVLEGDETAVETLRAEIRRNLDGIPEGDAPYRLAVSIGAARWEEGMDNTALIAAADAELYRLKHAQ